MTSMTAGWRHLLGFGWTEVQKKHFANGAAYDQLIVKR